MEGGSGGVLPVGRKGDRKKGSLRRCILQIAAVGATLDETADRTHDHGAQHSDLEFTRLTTAEMSIGRYLEDELRTCSGRSVGFYCLNFARLACGLSLITIVVQHRAVRNRN
jgi:hypothetical protein